MINNSGTVEISKVKQQSRGIAHKYMALFLYIEIYLSTFLSYRGLITPLNPFCSNTKTKLTHRITRQAWISMIANVSPHALGSIKPRLSWSTRITSHSFWSISTRWSIFPTLALQPHHELQVTCKNHTSFYTVSQ